MAPPERRTVRRLIINLEADGDLYVKGIVFRSGDERARDLLQGEVTRARPRGETLLVLLRADRLRPWGEVRRLIEWVTTVPDTEVAEVHLAVDVGGTIDGRIEARLRVPSPSGEGEAPTLALDLEDGRPGSFPRVRVGASSWTFPAGDPYARGLSLTVANAAWTELHDKLRLETRTTSALPVRIDSGVPWAHVAQFLALAHLTGADALDVRGTGATLGVTLSAPPGITRSRGAGRPHAPGVPLEPGARDPRDANPVLLIGIGVALAALVVLLPLARGRYRRGSSRVRSGPNETPPA